MPVIVGVGEVLWDVLPGGEHFGGAPANVAVHAAALGAEAWLVSAVGQDARGQAALERLAAANVDTTAVARLADHSTGVVHVSGDTAGQPSYQIAPNSAWDFIPWSSSVERAAQRADAICFGTLAQRSPVSRATIRRAVAATPHMTWRLCDLNLRQGHYNDDVIIESLTLANAVKLNAEELPVVARLCGADRAPAEDCLRALCDRFRLRLAALTRGAEGSLLVTPPAVSDCAAPSTQIADTVGAGDAFTAALLVGILAGRALADVNRRANAVAAFVCSRPGATPPIPVTLR
jgi:fructokinase